jgi:very-short-patch-repair endonuclease
MKKPADNNLQIPYDPSLKEKARELRNNLTPAEKHFWNALRTMPFYQNNTFNRQKPFGKYIVDFYCHEQQLVIEIDGDSHYEDQAQVYNQKRTEFLESHGLRVVRFTNQEVTENIDGVMEMLGKMIKKET